MITLDCTTAELWAIRDHCRRHADYGAEWSKSFDLRVLAALIAAEATPNHHAPMELTDEECWLIHRQVPHAAMVGTEQVGRNLLLKVGAALLEAVRQEAPQTEAEEPVLTEVPVPWTAAFRQDDAAAEEFSRLYPGPGSGEVTS